MEQRRAGWKESLDSLLNLFQTSMLVKGRVFGSCDPRVLRWSSSVFPSLNVLVTGGPGSKSTPSH
ncbi:hypothetical protein NQZ68_008730 [Dissostichus eleginoides]|nr:hypothetical protein NQZ68_008730 [Dissostichus eleginoides]